MQKTHFDLSMEFYTECSILHKVCSFTQSATFHTECVILHTMRLSFSKMEIKDLSQIFTTLHPFRCFDKHIVQCIILHTANCAANLRYFVVRQFFQKIMHL